MTEEPRWPSVDDVADAAAKAGDPPWLSSQTEVALAIKLCRNAWRASVDDPSKALVGEVRNVATPRGKIGYQRTVSTDGEPVWRSVIPYGSLSDWLLDADVKGCPVIGQVPGTPAAEVKP